jgi:hypothetical protein
LNHVLPSLMASYAIFRIYSCSCTRARTRSTAITQAAKAMKEVDLAESTLECAGEIDGKLDWLCTYIKGALRLESKRI